MAILKYLLLEYSEGLQKRLIDRFQQEDPHLEVKTIIAYLKRFKELKHRFPMDKRDITKLNWKEVEGLVDSFVSTRAKLGAVKLTDDVNLVYDNGSGVRIFHGADKDSCIKYSTGYTFCIGSKNKDRNMYKHYRTKLGGASPYFVVNQNLSVEHPYHISVVYVFVEKPDFFVITDATNDHNKEKNFNSKRSVKKFYEKQFKTKLDDKFVNVLEAKVIDIVKDIIDPIDKGSYYLCENDVNLTYLSENLTSLKFFDKPWIVKGNFYCSNNQLTTLEGAPQEVEKNFSCSNNQLTTLKGAPQKVGNHFTCSNNLLTSLEGAPREVGGDFGCHENNLTTLKGGPEKVGGNYDCSVNPLKSIEHAPKILGGDFFHSFTNISIEDLNRYLQSIGKLK